jgi:uncharacterized protein (TIRG00374 family)
MSRWGTIWRWLRLLLGVGLLLALLPIFAQPEFWATLTQVNVPLLIAATVLAAISVISKAWRWGVVMRWRGIALSNGYLIRSYFVSMFFNNFLPSGMGGDVLRAYQTARDTGRGAESVVGVVIERGSGMLGLFAAGSVAALIVPLPTGITLLVHGLFLGTLVALWALWAEVTGKLLATVGRWLPAAGIVHSVWEKITRLYDEFRQYRREWRLFAAVMGQSLITLVTTIFSVYLLLLAFGDGASLAGFAAVFAIVTAIDIIPFSLNGLGIREGTYVYFLGLLGTPASVALGVALLVRLIVALFAVVGGVWFILAKAPQ